MDTHGNPSHMIWWEGALQDRPGLQQTVAQHTDKIIQQVADSWETRGWPSNLAGLQYIRDHPHGKEQHSKPYKMQQMAWHSQVKASTELIKDIIGLQRHLPEEFTRCAPAFYSHG